MIQSHPDWKYFEKLYFESCFKALDLTVSAVRLYCFYQIEVLVIVHTVSTGAFEAQFGRTV